MAESPAQSELVDYLKAVLKWLYAKEDWYIVSNIGIYQTMDLLEYDSSRCSCLYWHSGDKRGAARSAKLEDATRQSACTQCSV